MNRFKYTNILLLVLSVLVMQVAGAQTFYLMRHAEKIDDGSKDPDLTSQGRLRAQNIAAMLADVGIKRIYTTDYKRTQQTAQPLASFLGVSVNSYDPRGLLEFANELKSMSSDAMIVGHSNTTPMLAYLLSGQEMRDLDEVDFDNVFQIIIKGDGVTVNTLKSLPSKVTQARSLIVTEAANYFNGQLTFDVMKQDKMLGEMVYQYQQTEGEYLLTEQLDIKSLKTAVQTQLTVDSETLMPVNMVMSGMKGEKVDVQLGWQGQHLVGYSHVPRAAYKTQGKISFDQQISKPSYERKSLMLLAHLIALKPNTDQLISWFNAADGHNHLVNIILEGEETIDVPAGTFETVKIQYSGGAPSYYIWVDKQQPKVVKIKEIKSPFSYELSDFEIHE